MNKTKIIRKFEILTHLSRISYWASLIALPLVIFLMAVFVQFITRSRLGADAATSSPISNPAMIFSSSSDERPYGYVDLAGIIKTYPPDFSRDGWLVFDSQEGAEEAKVEEKIRGFYVISEDYLYTGTIYEYSKLEESFLGNSQTRGAGVGELTDLINFNLLNGDTDFLLVLDQPIKELHEYNLAPPERASRADMTDTWALIIPYIITVGFYTTTLGSSILFLNSIEKERENKLLEVLLSSVNTRVFLMGKFTGLLLVGMLQLVVWGLIALVFYRITGDAFTLPPEAKIEPSIFIWAGIFLMLSYLLYSTLLGGIGVLVNNLRGAAVITSLISFPMYVPFIMYPALIQEPHGVIALVLSIIPLTAPTTILIRMIISQVPFWQPFLVSVLLVTANYLVIRSIARMFRSQRILTGQSIRSFFVGLVRPPA